MKTSSLKKRAALQDKSWIEKARAVHGEKYDYSLFEYVNRHAKGVIICPEHGAFSQDIASHLKGSKCPECSGRKRRTQQTFVADATDLFGSKFDYSEAVFSGMQTRIKIRCNAHGTVFEQTPHQHLRGIEACPECKADKWVANGAARRADWVSKVTTLGLAVAGSFEGNSFSPISLICEKHGEYTVNRVGDVVYNAVRCPKCANQRSKGEDELYDFLTEIGLTVIRKDRSIIKPKELDLYIPELALAIEYNGLYYHSSKFTSRTSHVRKTKLAEKAGVRLIHIFEDEWLYRQQAVKNALTAIAGKAHRTFARKYTITKQKASDVAEFLNTHHLQGGAKHGVAYSLIDSSGVTAAAMVFSKPVSERGVSDGMELIRFASNGVCVGAASRLFKAFVEDNPGCRIVSYSDARWFSGGMYAELGFEKTHTTRPDYFYVVGQQRKHKAAFKKSRLEVLFSDTYDSAKSEQQLCAENGFHRVYDCGKTKWEFVPS